MEEESNFSLRGLLHLIREKSGVWTFNLLGDVFLFLKKLGKDVLDILLNRESY